MLPPLVAAFSASNDQCQGVLRKRHPLTTACVGPEANYIYLGNAQLSAKLESQDGIDRVGYLRSSVFSRNVCEEMTDC
jgi:hypothetical protein